MKQFKLVVLGLLCAFTIMNCNSVDPMEEEPMEEEPMELALTVELDINESKVNQGEAVTFQSAVTGNPDTYSWTFEEGLPATWSDSEDPEITFHSYGVKKISLTVTRDSDGATATAEKEITVCLTEGLLAYYPLDGGAIDFGPFGFDGNVNGASVISNANNDTNSAMAFDGESYIVTSSMIDDSLSTGATFSAWINVEVGGGYNRILTNYSGESTGGDCLERVGFIFSTTDEEGIRISYASDGNDYIGRISAPNTITLGQWHHVVGVWKGNLSAGSDGFEIYIDGQRSDVENLEGGNVCPEFLESPLPFNMGRGFCAAGECAYYTGAIDEVKIFGRALSADEVVHLGQ